MNQPKTLPLVFEAVRDFLAKHAPYSQMREDALAFLIPRLKLAYFPKDSVIVDRSAEFPPLHIIQSGQRGQCHRGPRHDARPRAAAGRLLSGRLADCRRTTDAQLSSDRRRLCLPPARSTISRSCGRFRPEFAAYCTEAVTVLAQQSLAELQRHYSQVASDQHSLTRPLAHLIPSEPITCLATTSLRDALTQMKEHAVRSIIVVDEKSAPVGVFTLNDLRDRVVLQGLPLDTPVSQVMTPDPITLPAEATAAEAIQSMAAGGFHQMIVTSHGKVLGTIFEHDLFALQRVSLRQIHHAIRSARSIKALAHVAGDIRNLARNLLAQGVSAEALTRTIAALNDALTREVHQPRAAGP